MSPYRTIVTVGELGQIILNNVPVQAGECVEVVVRPCDIERLNRSEKLRQLLEETQSLPQLRELSKEDVAAEIAAYREGQ